MDLFLIVKRENGNIKPLCLIDSYKDALSRVSYLELAFPSSIFDIYKLETPSENHD